jgi:hypothetical protein
MELPIGKTVTNDMTDMNAAWHYDVTVLVVREATREEYLEQEKDNPAFKHHIIDRSDIRFYEVLMD